MEVIKVIAIVRNVAVTLASALKSREVSGRLHFKVDFISGDSVKLTRISSVRATKVKIISRIGLSATDTIKKFNLSENESTLLPVKLPKGSTSHDKYLVLQWNEGWRKYRSKFKVEIGPNVF